MAWAFADEHLHCILDDAPAVRLLPLAAVSQQWRKVVAELLRMRARDVRDQQWSAAMACGLAKDFSSKARAQQGCQALLERAARRSLATMRLVPEGVLAALLRP